MVLIRYDFFTRLIELPESTKTSAPVLVGNTVPCTVHGWKFGSSILALVWQTLWMICSWVKVFTLATSSFLLLIMFLKFSTSGSFMFSSWFSYGCVCSCVDTVSLGSGLGNTFDCQWKGVVVEFVVDCDTRSGVLFMMGCGLVKVVLTVLMVLLSDMANVASFRSSMLNV